MTQIFNYIDRPSPIHRLSGAAKFATLLLWMLAAMLSFNSFFLLFLTLSALALFRLSQIRLREVRLLLLLTLIFLVLNNLLIYLFSPELGVSIYGSRHLLCTLYGRYTLTLEQLLYHLNVILKYTSTIPLVLLFVASTQASEFAASLNRLGLSYRVSYAVALALRYIPDLITAYQTIALAQQARGIELSRKESLPRRLKAAARIIIPLILSSFDRIETVANAMELRGFGKHPKRSWYMGRPFSRGDLLFMLFGAFLLIFSISYNLWNGSRFWNPFH